VVGGSLIDGRELMPACDITARDPDISEIAYSEWNEFLEDS